MPLLSAFAAKFALGPIIGFVKEIIKLPIPAGIVGIAFAMALVWHFLAVNKAVREGIQKAGAAVEAEDRRRLSEATKKLSDMEESDAKKNAQIEVLTREKDDALELAKQEEIKRVEAENAKPDTVRVPNVRTVTLACPKVNNAEPKILECPKPKACPRIRRHSCLVEPIPDRILRSLN